MDDAFAASGLAAGGSFAGTAPRGSLGTFIGRRGSANLEKAGRRAAARAIDPAEQMEAEGAKSSEIRKAANQVLEADPDLGGLHKGADGMWRVEVRDDLRRSSTITGAEFWPNRSPQEIGLGSANDKAAILHEVRNDGTGALRSRPGL